MMRLIVNSFDDVEWLFSFFCFVRGADIIENSIIVSTLFMWRFQEKKKKKEEETDTEILTAAQSWAYHK